MTASFALHGRTALVTGARRGIGLAMAGALAEAGADIIAVSRSLDATGSEVEQRVLAAGRQFTGYSVDFGNRNAVCEFGERVLSEHPRIDILVNNAGDISRAPAVDYPETEWDRIVETDLTAQFLLTRALARPMLERRYGRIIFTASLLSHQGGVNVVAYTAAKSGLAGMTRALANEWASSGVAVNAVVPGYIATDNTAALRGDPTRSTAILDRIPAGRWGRAEDFEGVTVFLASDAAAYVHGALVPVDGGWLGR